MFVKSRSAGVLSRILLCCLLVFTGRSFAGSDENLGASKQASPPQIASISLASKPVIVFDHLRDKREPFHLPDAQVTAWKDIDGTVNLTIPHFEEYRLRGPDLLHLKSDPRKIFSSTIQASDIPEAHYNYYHWFSAPYTLDGQNVYVLTHTEWYACVLVGDCGSGSNQINSWVTSNNSFVSTDGGATWSANGADQKHLIANLGDHWTGSKELSLTVYHKALNHSGLMTPSRLIKEGDYYYSIGFEIHRDFSKLDTTTDEAPIDKYGYALLRTKDFTKPKGWEAWVAGSTYHLVTRGDFGVFLPVLNGSALNSSQVQMVFDLKSQQYIVIFTLWGNPGPIYYMTTNSLAAPVWSAPQIIAGSPTFQPDPRGPGGQNPCNTAFTPGNYVSILDANSPGMNFEFTNAALWLFYVVNPARCGGDNLARDLYRARLVVKYK
jgi:hypothetical protein